MLRIGFIHRGDKNERAKGGEEKEEKSAGRQTMGENGETEKKDREKKNPGTSFLPYPSEFEHRNLN